MYRDGPISILWQGLLFFYVLGKALLALLQICLIVWTYSAPISHVTKSSKFDRKSNVSGARFKRPTTISIKAVPAVVSRLGCEH